MNEAVLATPSGCEQRVAQEKPLNLREMVPEVVFVGGSAGAVFECRDEQALKPGIVEAELPRDGAVQGLDRKSVL